MKGKGQIFSCPLWFEIMAKSEKKVYIEILRAAATLAVVFLHINMTLVENYTATDLGVFNYAVFNDCYIFVKWAVPCFIMISGALLLNPERSITWIKIKKYVLRMIGVLLTFGIVYALIELVFNNKGFSPEMLIQAVLNTAQGSSWSHMWYIYMLIGLYLVTIPLRSVTSKLSQKDLEIILLIAIIGNFLIPSMNTILNMKFENYMLVSEYLVWYLLGYYLSVTNRNFIKAAWIGAPLSALIMIISESVSLYMKSEVFVLNHQRTNILTLILGASVFVIFKHLAQNKEKVGKICNFICYTSFGIYLIHPLFINIIYKVIGFTPLSLPIGIGIVVMFAVVFILSSLTAYIMKRIPLINKIL